MDLTQLKTQLLNAHEEERQALIERVAREATPTELVAIAGFLVDNAAPLRTAAMQILARARFAPAAGALLAVVKARDGHERAMALRALADLTQGVDKTRVLDGTRPFLDDRDEGVREAARALVSRLDEGEERSVPLAGANPIFGLLSPDKEKRRTALVRTLQEHGDPAREIAAALGETRSSVVRMDLLGGLGTLGPEAVARVALAVLPSADGDLVALVARHLEQKLTSADEATRLDLARAVLAAAERTKSPLARAAADACALALAPGLAAADQARRVGALDAEDLERLKDAFVTLDEEARSSALAALLEGLAKSPERAGAFAEVLYGDLGHLDFVQRASLLAVAMRAANASGDDADLARHLGPLARLLARLVPRGGGLPSQLVVGLRLSPQASDRFALIELLEALGTEEAAASLKQLVDKPAADEGDEAVKARAHEALERFRSDEVEVLIHPDGVELLPRYETAAGERLRAEGRFLIDHHGARYVLSEAGVPVGERDTPYGGCRCCFRPRELAESRGAEGVKGLPACPVSGKRHLVDPEAGAVLEESHPLGGCEVCESLRPLSREGERVLCPSCHTSYERDGERYRPKRPAPGGDGPVYVVMSAEGRAPTLPDVDDTPRPPTRQDLEELPPEVSRAMAANVVLVGRGSFRAWGATGIVVAKSGDEIAILTSRHAVEEVDGEQAGTRVPLTCYTITGEEVPTRVVWVASQGLDLALLCAKVQQPEGVDVIDLEKGRVPRPGDEIFAIGNALGLPWSYTAGPVSAVRTLPTRLGLDVRFLQTPMNLASGFGGGGVYLKDGTLCGVVSWYRTTGMHSETNFAVSVDSVIAGLRRERVRFGGAPLCASE